jgi:hypothetical protein
VQREHRRIGFGLRRQSFEVVSVTSRLPSVLGKGFELLALERLGVAGGRVLDDDSLLLDIRDTKSLVRERGVMSVASSGRSSQRSMSVPQVAPNGAAISYLSRAHV